MYVYIYICVYMIYRFTIQRILVCDGERGLATPTPSSTYLYMRERKRETHKRSQHSLKRARHSFKRSLCGIFIRVSITSTHKEPYCFHDILLSDGATGPAAVC